MLSGGIIVGRGQSKCAIRPGFCGDEVTSLLFAEDSSFERETDPELLERLHAIDPHMDMFVYAHKVNCATYDELTASQKQDVQDCLGYVPAKINFFTTKNVDTTFTPHHVPKLYQGRLIELMGLLHEHGIAHADLHGANMGLRDGKPVIFDFGNAVLTHNPAIFAQDEHDMERTFAPEAPRKRRRSRSREEEPPHDLMAAFAHATSEPRVTRMRFSKSPGKSPARAAGARSPARSPYRSPAKSPYRSPGRAPARSPYKSPSKKLFGGSMEALQKFYMKAYSNSRVNYRELREYIAKVCNAVSTLNRDVKYWQDEWNFGQGEGRARMLTMIRNFLMYGKERYDPLGLRGL